MALNYGNVASFTDNQAQTQYFDCDKEPNINAVIFGHTHVPTLIVGTNAQGKDTVYVNSGTWIDNNGDIPTCTYVTIDDNTAS